MTETRHGYTENEVNGAQCLEEQRTLSRRKERKSAVCVSVCDSVCERVLAVDPGEEGVASKRDVLIIVTSKVHQVTRKAVTTTIFPPLPKINSDQTSKLDLSAQYHTLNSVFRFGYCPRRLRLSLPFRVHQGLFQRF